VRARPGVGGWRRYRGEVPPGPNEPDEESQPFGALPGDDRRGDGGPDEDDEHDGHANGDTAAGANAIDEEGPEADDGLHTALPPRIEAWRRRSATGAILTGFALGLQQALEKEREDPGITMQTSGAPPRDLPVEADMELARPRHSVVSIRPWLLGNADPAGGPDPDREAAATVDAGDGADDRAEPAPEDG